MILYSIQDKNRPHPRIATGLGSAKPSGDWFINYLVIVNIYGGGSIGEGCVNNDGFSPPSGLFLFSIEYRIIDGIEIWEIV